MDIVSNSAQFEFKSAPAPFDFIEKGSNSPLIIACPHSGRYYPDYFINQSSLSLENLRESEDAYVDRICDDLPSLGISMICANYARSYIDLNRNPEILDNRIIDGAAHTSCTMTNSGFGIIPRIVGFGREIYKEKIPHSQAIERIEKIHFPYHQRLQDVIARTKAKFGRALLFDMHSMPNSALGSLKADIILGDRFGASCQPDTINFIEERFQFYGLNTRRNHPFAGGYTTINYGKPATKQEALQIEINRRLYMNEATLQPNSGLEEIKDIITKVFSDFINFVGNSS